MPDFLARIADKEAKPERLRLLAPHCRRLSQETARKTSIGFCISAWMQRWMNTSPL